MKTKRTPNTKVAELRKAGYKVSVYHDNQPCLVVLSSGLLRSATGKCLVTVTTKDGTEYEGHSLCVDKNYDKKKAIHIALGRAIKSMETGSKEYPTWDNVS